MLDINTRKRAHTINVSSSNGLLGYNVLTLDTKSILMFLCVSHHYTPKRLICFIHVHISLIPFWKEKYYVWWSMLLVGYYTVFMHVVMKDLLCRLPK